MSDNVSAEHFAPYLGKTFRPAGWDVSLTFVKLERHETGGEETPRKPFTLILRGSRDKLLPEGYYRFAIDDGPDFDLYIIPIHTPSRSHQDYQVAFN
jgi:hypothetical protein